jgi:hypothetical protein
MNEDRMLKLEGDTISCSGSSKEFLKEYRELTKRIKETQKEQEQWIQENLKQAYLEGYKYGSQGGLLDSS